MSFRKGNETMPREMIDELKAYGIVEYEDKEFYLVKDGGEKEEFGNICYLLDVIFGRSLDKGELSQKELQMLRYMTLTSSEYGISGSRMEEWSGMGKNTQDILSALSRKGWLEYNKEGRDLIDYAENNKRKSEGTYFMPMVIQSFILKREHMKSTISNSLHFIEGILLCSMFTRTSQLRLKCDVEQVNQTYEQAYCLLKCLEFDYKCKEDVEGLVLISQILSCMYKIADTYEKRENIYDTMEKLIFTLDEIQLFEDVENGCKASIYVNYIEMCFKYGKHNYIDFALSKYELLEFDIQSAYSLGRILTYKNLNEKAVVYLERVREYLEENNNEKQDYKLVDVYKLLELCYRFMSDYTTSSLYAKKIKECSKQNGMINPRNDYFDKSNEKRNFHSEQSWEELWNEDIEFILKQEKELNQYRRSYGDYHIDLYDRYVGFAYYCKKKGCDLISSCYNYANNMAIDEKKCECHIKERMTECVEKVLNKGIDSCEKAILISNRENKLRLGYVDDDEVSLAEMVVDGDDVKSITYNKHDIYRRLLDLYELVFLNLKNDEHQIFMYLNRLITFLNDIYKSDNTISIEEEYDCLIDNMCAIESVQSRMKLYAEEEIKFMYYIYALKKIKNVRKNLGMIIEGYKTIYSMWKDFSYDYSKMFCGNVFAMYEAYNLNIKEWEKQMEKCNLEKYDELMYCIRDLQFEE